MRKIEKRIKELESKVEQQGKFIDFLSKHNKDDLVKEYGCGWDSRTGFITYIFEGCLQSIALPYLGCDINTIENKYDYAIIELSTILNYKEIWKLDKRKNVMVDITSEYKKSTENKPSTVKQ